MDSVLISLQNLARLFWSEPFWFWLVFLTLLLVGLLLLLPKLSDILEKQKRLAVFNRISYDSMHDVVIPDGLGGSLFISHLLLMSDQVAVLNDKPYGGKIFGDTNVDQWTQSLRQGSYRFTNPLRELHSQVLAVNDLMSSPCAKGYLVFSNDSEFPWGQPDNVCLRKDLPKVFAKARQPLQDTVGQAWSGMQQRVVSNPARSSYLGRYLLSGLFLLAALGWVVLALFWQAPALQHVLGNF